jgi:hypothetical protein
MPPVAKVWSGRWSKMFASWQVLSVMFFRSEQRM